MSRCRPFGQPFDYIQVHEVAEQCGISTRGAELFLRLLPRFSGRETVTAQGFVPVHPIGNRSRWAVIFPVGRARAGTRGSGSSRFMGDSDRMYDAERGGGRGSKCCSAGACAPGPAPPPPSQNACAAGATLSPRGRTRSAGLLVQPRRAPSKACSGSTTTVAARHLAPGTTAARGGDALAGVHEQCAPPDGAGVAVDCAILLPVGTVSPMCTVAVMQAVGQSAGFCGAVAIYAAVWSRAGAGWVLVCARRGRQRRCSARVLARRCALLLRRRRRT